MRADNRPMLVGALGLLLGTLSPLSGEDRCAAEQVPSPPLFSAVGTADLHGGLV